MSPTGLGGIKMNEFVEKQQFKVVLSQARPVLFKSLEGGVVESSKALNYPSKDKLGFVDGKAVIIKGDE